MRSRKSELAQALASCRGAFIAVGIFSGVINILMLTGSIYMLQVYDRVLPSRSVPTLVGLTLIIIFLFGLQGLLDFVRQRIMTRVGSTLDSELAGRIFNIVVTLPLKGRTGVEGLQPLRDFDTVRAFLSGIGPTALFDLPWLPLYLGLCFLLHPWLGVIALVGAIVLFGLAVMTEVLSRKPLQEAVGHASSRQLQAEASRRNAEAIKAMGMGAPLARRWAAANDKYVLAQERASDASSGLGALSKVLRFLLQSLVLGTGAWLAILDLATPGVIIAASILTSRALAPIETAIAHWKSFLSARQSWKRLGDLLNALPPETEPMPLATPRQSLSVENLVVGIPGSREVIVSNVSFVLQAGDGLGVIGPSASGKSTLVRALVGVWPVLRGAIRLDGATLDHWSAAALGSAIGYMPQAIELFDGTVAENIARFSEKADPTQVVAAAKAAGAHDMILRLPEGYDTRTGEGAGSLSAGQRQRIALARALYGDPFVVVLDEPNSNLDSEGEAALTEAIKGVRARGAVVIVVAHRPSALAALDQVLVMRNGTMQALGPKDEVLRKTLVPQQPGAPAKPAAPHPQPLRAAAAGGNAERA
jgi:PrtD family type I secretion system ABC transporter